MAALSCLPITSDSDFYVLIYAGMKTLLKKYELPKQEEVNVYKQKLERIHAEFASSSK